MNRFKQTIIGSCLVAFVLLIGMSSHSKASHLMGADLYYECIGANTYQVYLDVYTDCSGAIGTGGCVFDAATCSWWSCSSANVPRLFVSSNSCGLCFDGGEFNSVSGPVEVSRQCAGANTTCNGGSLPGTYKWTFSKVITLPTQCNDWILRYCSYSRNAAITTIQNSNTTGMCVSSMINNTTSSCNSSVSFSNLPVPQICVGDTFCYNHGTINPDGDSLVYSFVMPKSHDGTNVNYFGGYSYQQPVKSTPAVSIDSSTGDICMTPTSTDVTAFAIRVKEYDNNGNLVGYITRDIQLRVRNCSNNMPNLDTSNVAGGNPNGKYTYNVCADSTLCVTFSANDPDGQNITMSWDSAITGASFNVNNNNTPSPTGVFCWTPGVSDIQSNPYMFTIQLEDDNCPYKGIQSFGVKVYVNNCNTSQPLVTATATQTDICSGDCTNISAAVSGGTSPFTYAWDNGVGSGAGPHNVCPSTTTTYHVTVTDSNGNQDSAGVTINIHTPPVANAGPDLTLCAGDSAIMNGSGGSNYLWNPGSALSCASCPNPTVYADSLLKYANLPQQYELIVSDSTGTCSDRDTMEVNAYDPAASLRSDTVICEGGSVSLNGGQDSSFAYTWSPQSGLTCGDCPNPTASPGSRTKYVLTVADSGNNCKAVDSVTIDVDKVNAVISPSSDQVICNSDSVSLSVTGGNTYSWSPATGLSCTNCDDPVAAPNVNTTYQVTATTIYGCTDSTSINFEVYDEPAPAFTAYDACEEESIQFSNNSSGSDISGFEWQFGDGNSSTDKNPQHAYSNSGTFNVTLTASNKGCQRTYQRTVNIIPTPEAAFTPNPQKTFINDKIVFNNETVDATAWIWDFGNSDSVAMEEPTYSYTDSGTYLVTLYADAGNGCADTAQRTVIIIPELSFYLPNAFTPNQDELNDRFAPIGSLQAIEDYEMTIWNRWGELIYKTKDKYAGWNGYRHNDGKLSPAGTYTYIVKYKVFDQDKWQRKEGYIQLINKRKLKK